MTLRLVLVGLVASLGFELPTQRDVKDWAREGRAWWDAQVAAWDAGMHDPAAGPRLAGAGGPRMPDGLDAFAPDARPAADGGDLAFEKAVEELVASYREDLEREDLPRESAAIEIVKVAEAAPVAPGGATAEMPPAPDADEPAGGQVDRIAAAVRLTGQAVEAWMTVLKGPAVVSLRP